MSRHFVRWADHASSSMLGPVVDGSRSNTGTISFPVATEPAHVIIRLYDAPIAGRMLGELILNDIPGGGCH